MLAVRLVRERFFVLTIARFRVAITTAALTIASFVVPVASPAATAPHPVRSKVTRVVLTAASGASTAQTLSAADVVGAQQRAGGRRGHASSASTEVAVPSLAVIGVTWAKGTGPGASVQYRQQTTGGWGYWTFIDADGADGPGPAESSHAGTRSGSVPIVVTGASNIQVRVITPDSGKAPVSPEVVVVDPGTWKLKITGRVDRERTYTYADLLARKLVEVPITIQCVSNEVGGDLIGTARWIGVPLAELLGEAGVQEGADQVIGRSVDGFTAGFPTKVALDGRDALVALGMSGRSLPAEHGFPARLIVPGLYGYVSATKWLQEIRLTTFADEQGYWVPLGWSRLGPIKTQARIDVPYVGARIGSGPTSIAGVAWAPTRGIAKVEVQVDAGPWRAAELGRVASDDTWVQWRLLWDAPTGKHTLAVRATDGTGAVQTGTEAPPDPDGATGHHTIAVVVG